MARISIPKLEVEYRSDEFKVHPFDVVDVLEDKLESLADATDEEITEAVKLVLDEAVTDGTWPSYRVRGIEDLIPFVRKELRDRIEAQTDSETEED